MNEMAIRELGSLYGLTVSETCVLDDAMRVLQMAAAANQAFFIIKFDGERATKRFTVIFNAPNLQGRIVRMDGDKIEECIDHVLMELISLKKSGEVQ
ncbi:hypothetical protein FOC34_15255 [Burkholderia multivorans]|uniref:hypothetical protein n=1 Tax=Burkholderia multivorans TaxID=87883 RepID=UPI000753E5AA|nr:hypothetical protein [Burkholderia multivorans]KVZ31968.1 hypothetical protein WL15_09475 [Burkholderia multivorans]QGR86608.1 hypothetical protein FOC34_15255 [Burkholderia multivorans]